MIIKTKNFELRAGLSDLIYLLFILANSLGIHACAGLAAWSALAQPSPRNGLIALTLLPTAAFYFWALSRMVTFRMTFKRDAE